MNAVPRGQSESRGELNTRPNNYDPAWELINHKMKRESGVGSMLCFSAERGSSWLGDRRGKTMVST